MHLHVTATSSMVCFRTTILLACSVSCTCIVSLRAVAPVSTRLTSVTFRDMFVRPGRVVHEHGQTEPGEGAWCTEKYLRTVEVGVNVSGGKVKLFCM
jgi:hypothetical protein